MSEMHGVKRARQTAEAIKSRKEKEQSKLKSYLSLTEDVFARKKSCDWSNDALDLTTRLLTINPEFYTIWNYRRSICTQGIFPKLSPNEINDVLSEDLALTMTFLRQHPKVYWIWNHRRWCLESIPDGPVDNPKGWKKATWAKELSTVEKMLDADARNFLAWNYRRYVLASMPEPRPDANELNYTKRKIESNFSNFSAWHQRSKVYSSIWENEQVNVDKIKDEEFDFVRQALYVDPNDQSAWIYHRWLIGSGENKTLLEREIVAIQELLTVEPDSKWCLESLVHYKQLLLTKHIEGTENAIDKQKAVMEDCIALLENLKRIDPQRFNRYHDLEHTTTQSTLCLSLAQATG